jgi:hypothetical protein
MKATHTGTCQVCGRRQMLPGDVLAKHGYTKQWHYFVGTCPGSGWKPFELSINRIQNAITSAQGTVASLQIQIRETRLTNADLWDHVYHKATWEHRQSYYTWEKRVAKDVVENYHNGGYHSAAFGEPGNRRSVAYGANEFSGCKTFIAARNALVHQVNEPYAMHLEAQVKQLESYIAWQKDRIKGWVPHPENLTPVKEK